MLSSIGLPFSEYIGPNDETEQERLSMGGIWTIEFGSFPLFQLYLPVLIRLNSTIPISLHPRYRSQSHSATIVRQTHPTSGAVLTSPSVPPNYHFETDDAEEEWVYSQPFDYIHGRALVSYFKHPPSIIAKIFANLTPAGYFEFQESIMPFKSIDGALAGTALGEFQIPCMAAAEKLRRPWTNGKNYGRWMREAGFVDVVEKSYYWATNQWVKGKKQKLQARYLKENLHEALPA